ncbi:MAG: hypothetical protein WDZ93_00060 [Candidatus Paceibacterota bacterium]
MRNWVRCVACVLCSFVLSVGTVRAGTLGFDLACEEEAELHNVMLNFVPIEDAVPVVQCSLLPDAFPLDSYTAVDMVLADCVVHFCEVTIVRAEYKGQFFFVALDWLSELDPDAFEHFAELYDPILPFGYPPMVKVLDEDQQLLAKLLE